jgi:peroxiredoxin
MGSRRRLWLLAGGVALAAALAVLTRPSLPEPVGRGSRAPEFALPRLGDGARVSLADLRGRAVLLNFWATWCKPCEDEMPAMQRLYGELAGDGFELLAVSVDDDPEDVGAFVERLGIGFPVLLDPDEDVARAYQTYRYPESLLIDGEGRVVERFVGPKEWDAAPYVARIRRLIEASPQVVSGAREDTLPAPVARGRAGGGRVGRAREGAAVGAGP